MGSLRLTLALVTNREQSCSCDRLLRFAAAPGWLATRSEDTTFQLSVPHGSSTIAIVPKLALVGWIEYVEAAPATMAPPRNGLPSPP